MSGAPEPEDDPGPQDDHGAEPPVDGPETVAEQRLLASLGRRAQKVNHARVVRLLELLGDADGGTLDEAGRREAENLAHQVVGSAGTFGFPTASTDASVVEEHFARTVGSGAGDDREAASVRSTLERLQALFAG